MNTHRVAVIAVVGALAPGSSHPLAFGEKACDDLHPNDRGYQVMANAVPLDFVR